MTEISDRKQDKWYMLDPTTNGYLVDEKGNILSLLDAREMMASAQFVTYRKAGDSREKLHEMTPEEMQLTAYYVKNLFRFQVDAVSQFGEKGVWFDVIPEHFSVKQWSREKAKHRLTMAPEYAKMKNGFDLERLLPVLQRAVKEAETMQEPEAVSAQCLLDSPQ